MTKLKIDLQIGCTTKQVPAKKDFHRWVQCAVKAENNDCYEVCIRLVNKDESQALNKQYRHKDKPTNVLSFSYGADTLPLLGDLVICSDIAIEEAAQENKLIEAHWAHLTIHGILHLLGYDHENEQDAVVMENKESTLLTELGFVDPYKI